MSVLLGQPNVVKMYYITLYVTQGQEQAIESLYKEKGWTYLKAAAPILTTMSPIVLPNGIGFLPNLGQKNLIISKPERPIRPKIDSGPSAVTTSDNVQVNQSKSAVSEVPDKPGHLTDTNSTAVEESAPKNIIIKTEDTSEDKSFGISQHSEEIIKCGTCHLLLKEQGFQRDHALLDCKKVMEESKTEYGYKCLKCDTIFVAADNYIWHFLNKTCELKLCIRCGIDDSNPEVFEKHQNSTCCTILHNTEKYDGKYMCSSCKTMFKATQVYMRHNLLGFCTGYSLTCDFCKKSFPLKRRACYNMHLRTHLNDRPYVCEQCGKAYIERKSLRNHMRKHTGEKPYKCRYEECTLYFPTAAHRKGHEMSRHMDLPKSHVCHKCGMAFKFSSGLNVHVNMVHSEERNFACEICKKTFKTDGILKKHQISHKTARDHVCELCGKGFVTELYLRSHLIRHTSEKNHTCLRCGKSFYSRQYLILHERVHTGDKPYHCKLCDYRCAVRGNLLKHIRGVHSKDNPNMFVGKD